ncbi:hypothetical protein [Chryseobacterium gambrini]|uniref:hypothetical protein n=1 Tax=Chryseobacterium gambrini TaxID=373672 RepID=UPI003D142C47
MEMTINLKAPISKFWKDYLIKYTDPRVDVAIVSKSLEVGYDTVRRLRLGEINVSNEKNKKAVEALVKIAIKNASEKREKLQSDENDMKENLSIVFDLI